MKYCAVLTMDNLVESNNEDKLLDQPMLDIGWKTEHVSWRNSSVKWEKYQAVIIRSTWDYQENADAFIQVLSDIENSSVQLLNPLKIAKWNINKQYLKEVSQNGAEIIPTIWVDRFEFDKIDFYFQQFNTKQIVIKPTISANSENTFWIDKATYSDSRDELIQSLNDKQLMVQPFIPAIIEEGEYSMFYFADQLSHCVLKTPKKGDFRVQEDYGSTMTKVQANQGLQKAGIKALQSLPEKVLYARVDLVEYQGSYKLMEIELIEPSLYFNLDETAPKRFVKAFENWHK